MWADLESFVLLSATADSTGHIRIRVALVGQGYDSENPGVTVSIEASDSIYYESIGKTIYGSHRAGFSGERLRILLDGKPLEALTSIAVAPPPAANGQERTSYVPRPNISVYRFMSLSKISLKLQKSRPLYLGKRPANRCICNQFKEIYEFGKY
jgi:hypothetical protein